MKVAALSLLLALTSCLGAEDPQTPEPAPAQAPSEGPASGPQPGAGPCIAKPGQVTFVDVKALIEKKCARCHSGDEDYTNFDIARDHIDELIARTNLSAADPRRMPKSPAPPLPDSEKRLLAEWKAQGLLATPECEATPTPVPPAPSPGVTPPPTEIRDSEHVSLDQIEALILNDLTGLDAEERDETRYLVLAHKWDRTRDAGELKTYQSGVDKALNAISPERDITLCKPLDDKQSVCRIYLDDFGLDEDDWEAIRALEPIKLVSNTTKGQLIRQLVGTEAWLHGDSFALTVHGNANLYYDLLGIDGLTLNQLLAGIGVEFQDGFADFSATLAGFFGSPISLNKNRLVSRHRSNEGAAWLTYDTIPVAQLANRNVFNFPLLDEVFQAFNLNANGDAFQFDAHELIFSLRNGLSGYALYDAVGNLQAAAPVNIVRDNESPFTAEIKNSISCHRCHSAGIIPFTDQVRGQVLANADQFNANVIEIVKALYKTQPTTNRLVNLDKAAYAAALDKINAESNKDPLNYLTDSLQADASAADIAALLFLEEAEFKRLLDGSPQGKAKIGQVLSGGTVGFAQVLDALPNIIADGRIGQDPLSTDQ